MSTIREQDRGQFTVVDDRTAQDFRLSFRARGVLLWLLSKPDDWTFTRESLAKEAPEGEDAMREVLRELTEFGYIARERLRGRDGLWFTHTRLYEVPATRGGLPPTGKPPSKYLVLIPSISTSGGKPPIDLTHRLGAIPESPEAFGPSSP